MAMSLEARVRGIMPFIIDGPIGALSLRARRRTVFSPMRVSCTMSTDSLSLSAVTPEGQVIGKLLKAAQELIKVSKAMAITKGTTGASGQTIVTGVGTVAWSAAAAAAATDVLLVLGFGHSKGTENLRRIIPKEHMLNRMGKGTDNQKGQPKKRSSKGPPGTINHRSTNLESGLREGNTNSGNRRDKSGSESDTSGTESRKQNGSDGSEVGPESQHYNQPE